MITTYGIISIACFSIQQKKRTYLRHDKKKSEYAVTTDIRRYLLTTTTKSESNNFCCFNARNCINVGLINTLLVQWDFIYMLKVEGESLKCTFRKSAERSC